MKYLAEQVALYLVLLLNVMDTLFLSLTVVAGTVRGLPLNKG